MPTNPHSGLRTRPASATDAEGIARVLVDGWRQTYSELLPADFLDTFRYDTHTEMTKQHLEELSDTSAVFVAVDGKTVVGVAMIRDSAEEDADSGAELDAIYVSTSRQRGGIGTNLLRAAVEWAIRRGHQSLSLWVLRDNPYRQFYDKLNGRVLSERMGVFGDTEVPTVAYGWDAIESLEAWLKARVRS